MASTKDISLLTSQALGVIRSYDKAKTEAEIDEVIRNLAQFVFHDKDFTPEDIETASLKVKRAEGVKMQIGSLVEDRTSSFQEWLVHVKGDTDLNYWSDYKRYLAEKDGFSSQVLFTIDQQTDQILSKCADPCSSEPSSRKGMVVGSVQSGKTSNYIGLITKAADYGYKVIIVIAGIPEDLRSQTQKRINYGFVGQDTSSMTTEGLIKTGVGEFRDESTIPPWSFTKEKFDFNASSANSSPVVLNSALDEPVVFVIKKNDKILGNLLQWLGSSSCLDPTGKIDLPLLLIDDEADNASVNTKYIKDQVSKINEKIRLILDCFTRSTYIGYTATPFANIFIDPASTDNMNRQDLFPRHFIVGLEPPSSYVGPHSIFLGESETCRDILVEANDFHDCIPLKHKKDLDPILPQSLIDAVYCFLLSDAIKDLRGIFDSTDSSMLVNVSHLKDVHSKLKFLLSEELDSIKAAIRTFGPLEHTHHTNHVIRRLENCYYKFYPDIEYSFESVKQVLLNTYKRAEVIVVNSSRQTTDTLTIGEKSHRSLIVIGGFSLSRGLTLEGLTITYFLRSTAMYDTLLQMGRWFGYRPGYEDICRIWMTKEAMEWYSHIALADIELRNDLADLQRSRLSPLDFGLRVRSHPDALLVTAKNKMGSSQEITAEIQLADRFIETIDIEADSEVIQKNLKVTDHLIENILRSSRADSVTSSIHHSAHGYLFKDISAGHVVSYINKFNSLSLLTRDPRPISSYIYDRQDDELAKWDVFIPSPSANRIAYVSNQSLSINLQRRTAILKSLKDGRDGNYLSLSSRGKVAGRGIERIGLSTEVVDELVKQWLVDHPDKTANNVPDSIFRVRKRKPLLVLHFLDISDTEQLAEATADVSDTITAWSISFPPTDSPQKAVEYRVNTSWIKSLNLSSDIEESDGDLDL